MNQVQRLGLFLAPLLTALLLPVTANAQLKYEAIIGTASDGNQILVLPNPADDPASPERITVPGLPADAQPHGVAYLGPRRALVADFFKFRVFVVDTTAAALIHTIDTSSVYDGTGSIAVSPDGNTALAWGFSPPGIAVMRAPFGPGVQLSSIPVDDRKAAFQTQGIVFAANGRAFVRGEDRIYVIDPPYTEIAFSMEQESRATTNPFAVSGSLAFSPDGNTLLGGGLLDFLDVYQAPFSAGKQPDARIPIGFQNDADGANGLAVTPDGRFALVVNNFVPEIALVEAPFEPGSTVTLLPMPTALISGCGESGTALCLGFEDLGISPAGDIAIAVGNSARNTTNPNAGYAQAAVITRSGDDFTVLAVEIGDGSLQSRGRGAGAVRFIPTEFAERIFRDRFEGGAAALGQDQGEDRIESTFKRALEGPPPYASNPFPGP